MNLVAISLGTHLVIPGVGFDGNPVVAFVEQTDGDWVEELLVLDADQVRRLVAERTSANLSVNGRNVDLSADEIRELGRLFLFAQGMMREFLEWMAEELQDDYVATIGEAQRLHVLN